MTALWSIWDRIEGLQEALVAAVDDGLTSGQIATRLNRDFKLTLTRNAIIGRIHRTGLQLSTPPDRPSWTAEQLDRRRMRLHQLDLARIEKARIRAEAEAKKRAEEAMPEPTPRGDVDDGCRWLHGEATQRNFCGAPKSETTAYCGFHRRVCFTAMSSMRAQRVLARAQIACEAA